MRSEFQSLRVRPSGSGGGAKHMKDKYVYKKMIIGGLLIINISGGQLNLIIFREKKPKLTLAIFLTFYLCGDVKFGVPNLCLIKSHALRQSHRGSNKKIS